MLFVLWVLGGSLGPSAVAFNLQPSPSSSRHLRPQNAPRKQETALSTQPGFSSLDKELAARAGERVETEVSSGFLKDRLTQYGYFTRTAGNVDAEVKAGEVPAGGLELGLRNFKRELLALRRSVRFNEYAAIEEEMKPEGIAKVGWDVGNWLVANVFQKADKFLEEKGIFEAVTPSQEFEWLKDDEKSLERIKSNRALLAKLKLSNENCWRREEDRREAEKKEGRPDPSPIVLVPYLTVCWLLDYLYDGRPIQRFWFLETVARMPYFAYTSVLHLYESLGWWRAGAELRKLHNAEEWNELHHLLIMESLGGDKNWIDRFMAQHAAVIYYWVCIALYVFAPNLSYAFSELVEGHATDTYEEFLATNAEVLKGLPAPVVAREYYTGGDYYMFDAFQGAELATSRRPKCDSLYDVFRNIADDENEHIVTMRACADETVQSFLEKQKTVLRSKSTPTQQADFVLKEKQSSA
uniref:Ubiquinol oxidase n=1 Tax=Chromera velia CCMP2878 TaxID=1169474 RepID=A0A0G4IE86_9ALVE|eukprot:Cvel_13636.t1-p1 / transcript=Cvel_13636.t1 / gene=Cvel_13636 / organism=Chromera_velia_CCMP2878 / gene_product=Ubiquinol oxidase 4, chloroplastic/chromoplastic, putative / transcript_product=Ubiquinol oxidase 4, chloroplastic/chromoplastic, putative / location=Cvel_scaffold940:5752-10612(+) / protein_length=466 / sequence_SO=supercontig / SO=protein_coding / is_pseudo=false